MSEREREDGLSHAVINTENHYLAALVSPQVSHANISLFIVLTQVRHERRTHTHTNAIVYAYTNTDTNKHTDTNVHANTHTHTLHKYQNTTVLKQSLLTL